MPTRAGLAFGSYQLDVEKKRLLREGDDVPLPAAHFDLLHLLVKRAGAVVTKEELIAAVWSDAAVTDNALNQAISRLRTTLDPARPTRYIETVTRRGYRFVVPVTPCEIGATEFDLDAMLAPHLAFMDGRAALEKLDLAGITSAIDTFEQQIARNPTDASTHVGLAMACALKFESTRADVRPDVDALKRAVPAAREACRLSPESAQAWAALGFVLLCAGNRPHAIAALRRSVSLDSTNWMHPLRLAFASWGGERLQAAARTLALLPSCAMARWLAATAFVARGAFTEADRELDCGLVAMRREEAAGSSRLGAVALHLLKAMLLLARGNDDEAIAECERELALESRGHLYAREVAANAWYVIGACHLKKGRVEPALAALKEALARVPRHPMAHAAMAILTNRELTIPVTEGEPFECNMARAAMLVAKGEVPAAAQLIAMALSTAPAGNAGWTVPLDPLLRVRESPDEWADALAILASRAV